MENIKELISDIRKLEQVEAIALGGSRATGLSDKNSDYDVYVYCNLEINSTVRKNILQKYCSYMEIENRYWELEDDCVLNIGIIIELIYRDLESFDQSIKSVVINNNANNGYTTCMWNNLINCKILFDRNGKLEALKKKYDMQYPEALRKNIINKNLELLFGHIPSFSDQIIKASKRGDIACVNHRTTEFLASYFDLVFAYNRITHPGEKRMVENCLIKCDSLPNDFEKNINGLLDSMFNKDVLEDTINSIIKEIKDWLKL